MLFINALLDAKVDGVAEEAVKKIEPISVPDSLLLSVIGMAIVFVVLVLLIIVIKMLTAFTGKRAAAPDIAGMLAPVLADSAGLPVSAKVPANGSFGECALHTVDDKTAAMLMAIVADDSDIPLNELQFISIREVCKK